MKNQIIIHAAGQQTRIALIENGELAQFFIESPENQRTVGDIYVADVRKVMAGIRAAFVNLNTPKDAFLHFSDLGEHLEDYIVMLNGKDAIRKDDLKRLTEYRKLKGAKGESSQGNPKTGLTTEEQNLMGNCLQTGQKLLVQIVKEPIGSKGPRVSTNISLAGRFLVLIPMGDYIAVSKRIRSYKERKTLRQLVADRLPNGFGVIVRTVAEGVDPELVEADLRELLDKWTGMMALLAEAKPPTLLHRDLEMTESLIRDLFAKDYDRILIDDKKMYAQLRQYVAKIAPSMLPNIQLYQKSEHIFDHMRIHSDVESIFSPRVKIPSGGYLIFEQTEAMVVVDVNSGRYAAKKAQEDNSLKTNLEAAREIAKQLRLRDMGGIIVVDFIDLKEDANRKKVYDELKKEFRKDRAKTNILPMSDFGLVQITRQRIRPSVVNSVSRVCPMCGGSGEMVSHNTILSDLEGWLNKFRHTTKFWSVDLHLNPYMKGMLTKGLFSQQFRWMIKYRLRLNLVEDAQISMNDYRFTLSGSDVDITESIMLNQSIDEAIKAAEQRLAEMETEDRRDISKLDIYKKDDDEEAPAAAPAAKPGPRNALSDFKPAKPKAEPKPPVKKAEPEVPKAPKEPAAPKPEKQPDPSIEGLPLALDVARAYKAAKEPATTQPEPVAEETKAAVASLITNVVAAKKRPSKKEAASATPETVSETPDSTPTPKPKPKPRPKSKKPPVEPIPPKSTEDPS
jgi:ribonuclease G